MWKSDTLLMVMNSASQVIKTKWIVRSCYPVAVRTILADASLGTETKDELRNFNKRREKEHFVMR